MKSEVYYSRNILIVEKTHDKKKEEVKPKLSGEKNVSRNIFRVLIHFVKLDDNFGQVKFIKLK